METIVVERVLDDPLDMEWLSTQRGQLVTCMQAHNVSLKHSYVSPDRKRMICIYEAPDAESVRLALRTAGVLPFDNAWKASILRPQDL